MNKDINKEKIKLLVILGPTASGKSDFAVEIARKCNGEIISADSRQVYKGLDIGAGKITSMEMKGIPHHLLNVVSPTQTFTVQDFKDQAEEAITEISSRGKLPILCGGTGFYIDAVIDGIILPDVPRNDALRAELEQKSTEELFSALLKADLKRAEAIGEHNRPRLMRALEITETLGTVPALQKNSAEYDVLKIGINTTLSELQQKISKRLLARLENGMIDEAKKLYASGLSYKRMFSLGLEYRYLGLYLQQQVSYEHMVERLTIEIFQYAKRQLQWWKRDKKIKWYSLEQKETMVKAVENFLMQR